MFKFVNSAVVVTILALAMPCAAAPLQAQEMPAPQATPESDELTAEDVLTVAIGCVATYDTVLAQGKGGAKTAEIKQAREVAVMIYKEFSGETDEQVAESVRLADEIFPKMLAEGGDMKLEDYQQTCDALFMDEEMAATVNTPAT